MRVLMLNVVLAHPFFNNGMVWIGIFIFNNDFAAILISSVQAIPMIPSYECLSIILLTQEAPGRTYTS